MKNKKYFTILFLGVALYTLLKILSHSLEKKQTITQITPRENEQVAIVEKKDITQNLPSQDQSKVGLETGGNWRSR